MYFDQFNSPLGAVTVASKDGKNLFEVHLESDRYFKEVPEVWQKVAGLNILEITKQQLLDYFAGRRKYFDIPLTFSGTELQKQTWLQLTKLPYGKTISYKQLASQTSKPRAIRAVASAVGRNPLCIIIPCHRIIASDGSLGGYGSGIDHKIFLLNLEGN